MSNDCKEHVTIKPEYNMDDLNKSVNLQDLIKAINEGVFACSGVCPETLCSYYGISLKYPTLREFLNKTHNEIEAKYHKNNVIYGVRDAFKFSSIEDFENGKIYNADLFDRLHVIGYTVHEWQKDWQPSDYFVEFETLESLDILHNKLVKKSYNIFEISRRCNNENL